MAKPKVTDEAVKKATGKTWEQWFTLLTKAGGKDMDHKEIVAYLTKKKLVKLPKVVAPKKKPVAKKKGAKAKAKAAKPVKVAKAPAAGWWEQNITSEYEKSIKRKVTGETADVGFQIGVQKTFPMVASKSWQLLFTPPAKKIWMGDTPAENFKVGDTFTTAKGDTGEVRGLTDGEYIRYTRTEAGAKQPTTIQVRVTSAGTKSSIQFHEEHIKNAKQRELRRRHWQSALDRIAGLIKPATPQ